MKNLDFSTVALVAVLCLLSGAVDAQGMPGGGMGRPGGSGKGYQQGTDRPAKSNPSGPMQANDPVAALERELPSLRVDLKLTPEQAAPWDSFERGVRDIADMGRAKRRRAPSPATDNDGAVSAQGMLFAWSEDERMKADAMATLTRKFDALYAQLNNVQRLEIDRRFALSQSDPLGMR